MDAKPLIRDFIGKNFYLPDASVLNDDASLMEQGIVDSTGVLELIGFLERTFGISVADTETVPENLDSIARIVAYVQRKRPAVD